MNLMSLLELRKAAKEKNLKRHQQSEKAGADRIFKK